MDRLFSLSLAEIRLSLAHILWHFDMEICEETGKEWADQRAWFTYQKKPLMMRLTPQVWIGGGEDGPPVP